LLLAAQPTRGLDVGAIEFVWDQLRARREAGVGVLLISTDLEEVMALADRCYVMYKGQLVRSWTRSELDREAVGLAMGGALEAEPTVLSEGKG
jgi:simple sugar transport system ATP-binding protein